MYYKRATFTKRERFERIGTADFLATAGGILSLYLGISLLSIAELVYFFTIRPLCNVLMRLRRRHANRLPRKPRKLRRIQPKRTGKPVKEFLVKSTRRPHDVGSMGKRVLY